MASRTERQRQRQRRWHHHPALHPWYNAVLTAGLSVALALAALAAWRWGIRDAVLLPAGPEQCRAAAGACWAFVQEKAQLLAVGLFPRDMLWRPCTALALLALTLGISAAPRCWSRWLALLWAAAIALVIGLLHGAWLGLPVVRSEQWGGLLLTLLLILGSTLLAFPAGLLLAFGRRSRQAPLRLLCTTYIELMRSVPLLAVLFSVSLLLPLLLPSAGDAPKVLRALFGIALCMAAYFAEAIRGGLSAVPGGQWEAGASIGLSRWHAVRLVILPQALRVALPALVTTFLDFFKGTSLVLLIGVFDLMGATRAALADLPWQSFFLELYLTVGLVYFILSFIVSRYGAWLEAKLHHGD
ncbi:amino acid ABC transporter permease [Corticibacter populi]|uniref:Amino acid ABC transporter permease n=1 Tax=Corticibacter populi TaxID=1550736 RepID=A0A3M6QXG2_9BURK|nr:amino acid ABC transporter permease [Corticibacter populi]RMX07715.1 amino acid ABC transporter permease [Corticibacter populi]RZS30230.1 amino acid ABC transporter membrane protein 2 (PAAT family) [Corticibacter populi]